VLVLLPVWWWPQVASQDGPSHLYSATVLNESLAGRGPSTAVYEVAWRPLPNWAGPLLLAALLRLFRLAIIPPLMLSITCAAPVVAVVLLRREVECAEDRRASRGSFWIAAVACGLATGHAWSMGFDSFCLGIVAALGVIALYVRNRGRLDWRRFLAVSALLTFTFFCHLVPWAFAVATIAGLAIIGPSQKVPSQPQVGSPRRRWLAATFLAAVPCLVIYGSLSVGRGGGLELDWRHLRGFHPTGVRSWLMLLDRADCVSLRAFDPEPAGALSSARLAGWALARIALDPFALLLFAALLQAVGTLVVDLRAKDRRHLGWFVLGFTGVVLALFIPDGTPRNGSLLPFRVMLCSLLLLLMFVRFDLPRWLNVLTSLFVAAALGLQTAAIWDFDATANRQLLEVQTAATSIPTGQRIFQMGTRQDSRFLADPLLHCDGYAGLWTGGIVLSNYEAAHYYFPVKLRPAYPQSLLTFLSELQTLDLDRDADRTRLQGFLREHQPYIDVLLVRTTDNRFAPLARPWFGEVLWHSDNLLVLARQASR
jgi:hypothetical protein